MCGVTPPVTFVVCETSCAEQRGNFKSDHEGDLAACHHQNFKCILKPEQTCTVSLDTHPVKGKPQYQLKRKRLKQACFTAIDRALFVKVWHVQKHTECNTWFDSCLILEARSLCSTAASFLLNSSSKAGDTRLKSSD